MPEIWGNFLRSEPTKQFMRLSLTPQNGLGLLLHRKVNATSRVVASGSTSACQLAFWRVPAINQVDISWFVRFVFLLKIGFVDVPVTTIGLVCSLQSLEIRLNWNGRVFLFRARSVLPLWRNCSLDVHRAPAVKSCLRGVLLTIAWRAWGVVAQSFWWIYWVYWCCWPNFLGFIFLDPHLWVFKFGRSVNVEVMPTPKSGTFCKAHASSMCRAAMVTHFALMLLLAIIAEVPIHAFGPSNRLRVLWHSWQKCKKSNRCWRWNNDRLFKLEVLNHFFCERIQFFRFLKDGRTARCQKTYLDVEFCRSDLLLNLWHLSVLSRLSRFRSDGKWTKFSWSATLCTSTVFCWKRLLIELKNTQIDWHT